MTVPEIGTPWSWTPTAFTVHTDKDAGVIGATVRVHGRVTYVNLAHGWFRAEAAFTGGVIRECFHFASRARTF